MRFIEEGRFHSCLSLPDTAICYLKMYFIYWGWANFNCMMFLPVTNLAMHDMWVIIAHVYL